MKWYNPIDMGKLEILQLRIQNLGSAPSSPVPGQIYYDSTLFKVRWFNGTIWVDASSSGGSGYATIQDDGVAATARTIVNFASTASVASTVTDNAGSTRSDVTMDVQYGAITAQTAFGASTANGSASTAARSDHTHGTPVHDATAHSAISLSALAAPTAALSAGSQKITNLAAGTLATDATTLGQVQSLIDTGTNKTSVRVATTVAGTLATSFANGQVVDGVTIATGDRILLKNQATGAENGPYTVNASGAPTRSTDADISAEVKGGLSCWVNEGTTNGDTRWVLTTNDPITVGTTALTFVQDFAASATSAGAGLTASGGAINVGAGTGIFVAADVVNVDVSVVVRKVFFVITGNAVTTSFPLAHGLANGAPSITVWDTLASPNALIGTPDTTRTDDNNHNLIFAVAPGATQTYRVMVMG
jgi:hypothetical protein